MLNETIDLRNIHWYLGWFRWLKLFVTREVYPTGKGWNGGKNYKFEAWKYCERCKRWSTMFYEHGTWYC